MDVTMDEDGTKMRSGGGGDCAPTQLSCEHANKHEVVAPTFAGGGRFGWREGKVRGRQLRIRLAGLCSTLGKRLRTGFTGLGTGLGGEYLHVASSSWFEDGECFGRSKSLSALLEPELSPGSFGVAAIGGLYCSVSVRDCRAPRTRGVGLGVVFL